MPPTAEEDGASSKASHEDDYDPRNPELIAPATQEEVERRERELLAQQISKLEAAMSRREQKQPKIFRHYEKVLGDLRRKAGYGGLGMIRPHSTACFSQESLLDSSSEEEMSTASAPVRSKLSAPAGTAMSRRIWSVPTGLCGLDAQAAKPQQPVRPSDFDLEEVPSEVEASSPQVNAIPDGLALQGALHKRNGSCLHTGSCRDASASSPLIQWPSLLRPAEHVQGAAWQATACFTGMSLEGRVGAAQLKGTAAVAHSAAPPPRKPSLAPAAELAASAVARGPGGKEGGRGRRLGSRLLTQSCPDLRAPAVVWGVSARAAAADQEWEDDVVVEL